ncbi:MAG TPA: BatA and WFA domain-containing protein [Kofleriaceae bacterium]|nr:BatA and WFA domain-containing protein [Kofleriaceae bacterium]
MRFTNPWAFAFLAIAAPIVYAYLFRRSNQKLQVASTILLRVIRDEQPAAQRARARLRHRLSLVMVLLALLLTLVAVIGPKSGAPPHRYIVVVDTSASMAVHRSDQSRLERAASAVKELSKELRTDDEMALIVTGAEPGVLVPPTHTFADVVAQAQDVARKGATGDNRDDALAFELADGLCRDPKHTTVVVFSDGAGLTAPPMRCNVNHVALGAPAENVGIAALAARSVDGMGAYDVHVAVASTAAAERDVEVILSAAGSVIDVVALHVAAGGDAEETVRINVERGQELTAAIGGEHHDALALDDRASVSLPDDAPVSVLLVTSRPKSLLGEALKLHPRVRLTIAPPTAIPTTPVHLVILENDTVAPLPPAARVVGFGAVPAGAPITLGAAATDRGVVRWDFDAPWFRYVDLREVFIAAAKHVVGGRSIMDSASGALAATARWDDRELVVIGFDGTQTDLTLRPAFPNLVANLVDWAAPPAEARPPVGVLSAAESHVDATPLPGAAFVTPNNTVSGRLMLQAAIVLAALVLLGEQLWLRRGRKTVGP